MRSLRTIEMLLVCFLIIGNIFAGSAAAQQTEKIKESEMLQYVKLKLAEVLMKRRTDA